MGDVKKGSVYAAIFAAGLAGGGAGGDQLAQKEIDAANARADAVQAVVDKLDQHDPTIKSYIRYASEQAITDVLVPRIVFDRAAQLKMLADDISADVVEGESVALHGLSQRLAEKVSGDDWLTWYNQNFAVYLQSQIATGKAVGNLDSDQLVSLADVVTTMHATADLLSAPKPVDLAVNDAVQAEEDALRAQAQQGL